MGENLSREKNLMAEQFMDRGFETEGVSTAEPVETSKSASLPGPLGVDIGSYRIGVSCSAPDGITHHSRLNFFFSIPYSKLTREVLDKKGIDYFVDDDSLVVIGDAADRFSMVMNAQVRRPMRAGLLNPSETKGQRVLQKIVEGLVSPAERPGDLVCINVPSVPEGMEPQLAYHEAILKSIFLPMGFRVKTLNEALAVIFSELEETGFSGISITLGGGLCNGCLAYLSLPIFTFNTSKAGDFIDESAAAVTGMLPSEVRVVKENELDLSRPSRNHVEKALHIYYEQAVASILEELKNSMNRCSRLPRIHQPLPLVLAGGSTLPKGFLEKFLRLFAEYTFPIPLSGVRLAADPLAATANGALKSALAS